MTLVARREWKGSPNPPRVRLQSVRRPGDDRRLSPEPSGSCARAYRELAAALEGGGATTEAAAAEAKAGRIRPKRAVRRPLPAGTSSTKVRVEEGAGQIARRDEPRQIRRLPACDTMLRRNCPQAALIEEPFRFADLHVEPAFLKDRRELLRTLGMRRRVRQPRHRVERNQIDERVAASQDVREFRSLERRVVDPGQQGRTRTSPALPVFSR